MVIPFPNMRHLTYYTQDDHRLDIFNSWLGKETIYYDGRLVSKQRSISGGRHSFNVCENQQLAQYQVRVRFRWPQLIGFDIYRNGRALLLC